VKDPESGKPLIDLILERPAKRELENDSQLALDLGVPIPTIDAAIVARILSSQKEAGWSEQADHGPCYREIRSPQRHHEELRSPCPIRVQDLLLCAGNESNQGRFRRVWLEHQPQRVCAHLAGRLHHSRQVFGKIKEAYLRNPSLAIFC